MYAVVRTGGKQYRVAPGDVIRVERLSAEAGAEVELEDVLMLGGDSTPVQFGLPRLAGAVVTATVVEQMRDATVLVFKKKRRHNYRRKKGHRQHLTVLRIGEILPPGSPRKVLAAPAAAAQAAPAAQAVPAAQAAPAAKPAPAATKAPAPAAKPAPAPKKAEPPKKEAAAKKPTPPRKEAAAAKKPAKPTATHAKAKPKAAGKAKPKKR